MLPYGGAWPGGRGNRKGEKKMDFGVAGKLGGHYLAEQYRKNAAAGKSEGVSFAERQNY